MKIIETRLQWFCKKYQIIIRYQKIQATSLNKKYIGFDISKNKLDWR